MLKTRALVALIALPILLVLTVIGGELFAVFVLAVLVIGGDEYRRLLWQGDFRPPLGLILALIGLGFAATWFARPDWRAPGLAGVLIVAGAYAVWGMERKQAQPVFNAGLAVFGGLYIGWLGSYVLAVRMLEEGAYLVVFLYGCVALSDTAAYFVGSQWGKHKMAPHVSPNKSWEGYLGSSISGLLFGAVVGGVPASDVLNLGHGAILGLLIGTLGTIGDLAISAVKRQVGAKDSSHLIPGHGGLLDRMDSVLVAAAVSYYYLTWFVV